MWVKIKHLGESLKSYDGRRVRAGKHDSRERRLFFLDDGTPNYSDDSGGGEVDPESWEIDVNS